MLWTKRKSFDVYCYLTSEKWVFKKQMLSNAKYCAIIWLRLCSNQMNGKTLLLLLKLLFSEVNQKIVLKKTWFESYFCRKENKFIEIRENFWQYFRNFLIPRVEKVLSCQRFRGSHRMISSVSYVRFLLK
jgi:hypothetical protein